MERVRHSTSDGMANHIRKHPSDPCGALTRAQPAEQHDVLHFTTFPSLSGLLPGDRDLRRMPARNLSASEALCMADISPSNDGSSILGPSKREIQGSGSSSGRKVGWLSSHDAVPGQHLPPQRPLRPSLPPSVPADLAANSSQAQPPLSNRQRVLRDSVPPALGIPRSTDMPLDCLEEDESLSLHQEESERASYFDERVTSESHLLARVVASDAQHTAAPLRHHKSVPFSASGQDSQPAAPRHRTRRGSWLAINDAVPAAALLPQTRPAGPLAVGKARSILQTQPSSPSRMLQQSQSVGQYGSLCQGQSLAKAERIGLHNETADYSCINSPPSCRDPPRHLLQAPMYGALLPPNPAPAAESKATPSPRKLLTSLSSNSAMSPLVKLQALFASGTAAARRPEPSELLAEVSSETLEDSTDVWGTQGAARRDSSVSAAQRVAAWEHSPRQRPGQPDATPGPSPHVFPLSECTPSPRQPTSGGRGQSEDAHGVSWSPNASRRRLVAHATSQGSDGGSQARASPLSSADSVFKSPVSVTAVQVVCAGYKLSEPMGHCEPAQRGSPLSHFTAPSSAAVSAHKTEASPMGQLTALFNRVPSLNKSTPQRPPAPVVATSPSTPLKRAGKGALPMVDC